MATKVDPAFQGVGSRLGTEIWRIENFQPVPVPKSEHGRFYMGDSYIVLQTSGKGSGAFLYDIHFWIGRDTSQDEAGTAAIKTVELDASLGGRAVQHRELQGLESDKFLTYFKPCIIPLEGGVASGFKTPEEDKFETRLYICRGKRAVRMKQVPFARSSLNHDDVFILDTENKIFQFNGANSNIQERAKALEVIQVLKEKYHGGVCDVAIVDDGKLDTESDSGEFWVNMGGFAPIGKKVVGEDDIIPEATPAKLFSITGEKVEPIEADLSKSLLENDKCFLMDCGAEVFIWVGRNTQVDERKAAYQAAEEFVSSQNRPRATRITRLIQGFETHSFKANFGSWPSGSASESVGEGRGKVAALLKQQGGAKGGGKGAAKSAPGEEEVPPLLEGGGKMEVWYIDGSDKTPLAKEDHGKFHCGDCYIVLYTYHGGERKEDFFLCCWIGKDSIEEDQTTAAALAGKMFNSLKGRPTQGFIYQDKEPPQFIALFQPMVILKGGLGSGYKNLVAEKGVNDDTYTPNGVALIRVYGPAAHKSKAVQIDAEATSLNSKECFLLQTSSTLFIWLGKESDHEKQQLAAKFAEYLKPGVTLKHAKEGTETQAFWFALGGKQNYVSKKSPPDTVRDPRLFAYSFNKEGKFQVEEVYNFTQDDLLTEDILILDTKAEVFVWVGQSVEPKEKQAAFDIGRKYIELAAFLEGLNRNVPLYKVAEGLEPCFFTKYFSWDSSKANVPGNSFQKKVAILFGAGQVVDDKSGGGNRGGATQRAEALAALNSAFTGGKGGSNPGSVKKVAGGGQRAAAVAALSQALTAEKLTSPSKSEAADEPEPAEEKEPEEPAPESEPSADNPEEETDENLISSDDNTFTYDQVKAKSENPVAGIDFKKREAYLSDEEFESIFSMPKEEFYKLPKWKQDQLKKKYDLF